jgi:hypothetical protein
VIAVLAAIGRERSGNLSSAIRRFVRNLPSANR